MKIAVCGKGGVGKTTIAAHLAKDFSKKSRVLVIDADASLNLASEFGLKDVRSIIEMKDIVDKRARFPGGLISMNPKVADLVDEFAVKISKNLRLLALGTVKKAGTGCLCPENSVLRALLQDIVLNRSDFVLIDLEAGLEPMSRGTIRGIDAIIAVTEPSTASVEVTKKLIKFAKELDIRTPLIVSNKIEGKKDSEFLENIFKEDIFFSIGYDKRIRSSSRRGSALEIRVPKIEKLAKEIEKAL